jgi:hypothetical protein
MALTEAEVQAKTPIPPTGGTGEADIVRKQQRLDDLRFLRQMEDTYGIPNLLHRLQDDYPENIRQQKEAVRAAGRAIIETREEVEYQEAILKAEIESEVSPSNGKPIFSNEGARKAELIRRKKNSAEYQEALKALRDAEDIQSSAQFELDKLTDKFNGAMYASRIIAGCLNLIAK